MAKAEKERNHDFFILSVKLRHTQSRRDSTPEEYYELFRRIYTKKIHAESSNGKHCIIKLLIDEKDDNGNVQYCHGLLAQFTYIENEKWFNLDTLDLDDEFRVPEGLFPDAVITEIVFIPKAHRIAIRTSSKAKISPYPLKRFFENAAQRVVDASQYVNVDVATSSKTIEEILNANVKKIEIDVNYSNFDSGDELSEFIEEQMRESNTSRIETTATQKPGNPIKPRNSVLLSGLIQLAENNGEVKATTINENGRTEVIKTTAHPRKESVKGTMSQFSRLVYEKILRIFPRRNA
jgi:Domain of unknown function (DUF4747)